MNHLNITFFVAAGLMLATQRIHSGGMLRRALSFPPCSESRAVDTNVMRYRFTSEVKTPFKYGVVLAGAATNERPPGAFSAMAATGT